MRLFARIEVTLDEDADEVDFERLVAEDVDLALFVRDTVQRLEQEHGAGWEADLHIEPISKEDA